MLQDMNLQQIAEKILITESAIAKMMAKLRKRFNVKTNSTLFLTGYHSMWANYNEAILDLDNSFSIVNVTGVPHELSETLNSKWINKKTFILTGRKDSIPFPNDRCIGVFSLDTSYSLNHELYIGDHDTIEWPGKWKNLDYIDTNNIYIGGTHNFCQYEICNQISWFSLTNMDSLLNVRWEKFYGGNAYYVLMGIRATKDGGCLLFGSIYDSVTQVNERDVYVIKVDHNGLVGVNDNKTDPSVHDAIVFPNPGSDYLIIESGPQISRAQFMMTSIEGKQVIAKTLDKRRTTLETKSLPSGTYVWRIVFNDRIIETGKWIKE